MANRKYFGTDGVRGKVGTYPITPDFALKLGWAAGKVLASQGSRTVLIGKDTRISGYMLESALEAGLAAAGLTAAFTGPMPTPAVAYLTRTFRLEAGIVISASHNPYYDNGIKFFSSQGTKLPDDIEEAIEAMLDKPMDCVESADLGKASRISDAAGRYIEFCKSTFPAHLGLDGYKIVVDCANGATYHIAPNVLRELGAEVIEIGTDPNGININEKCGATDVKALQEKVLETKADVGLAYDGDADRLIAVDNTGAIINGDLIIAIIAEYMQKRGLLNDNKVVTTVLSNMGFEKYLDEKGIGLIRANVGDRYVLEKMKEYGLNIGGEQSGHILMLDYNTTGDGVLSSIQLVAAVLESGKTLRELVKGIELWPQDSKNIFVAKEKKATWETNKELIDFIKAKEKEIAGKGRILVRASGTESLIRVMVEAESQEIVDKYVAELSKKVEETLC